MFSAMCPLNIFINVFKLISNVSVTLCYLGWVCYIVFCKVYSVVYYYNVSFSGFITSVGEERAGFSAIDYS